jgi:hypothetical protein
VTKKKILPKLIDSRTEDEDRPESAVEWSRFVLSDPEQEQTLERHLKKHYRPEARAVFKSFFRRLLANGSLDIEHLKLVPNPVKDAKKTTFDQVFEACMEVAFPPYSEKLVADLFGPEYEKSRDVKLWRCLFPKKFGITHVIVRAETFQQAFALASDYACRVSLRMYQKLPIDLTIRVSKMSSKALAETVRLRKANRKIKLRQRNQKGPAYTTKEILGARIVACGHNRQPEFRIFHDQEFYEWGELKNRARVIRASRIETETFEKSLPEEYSLHHGNPLKGPGK